MVNNKPYGVFNVFAPNKGGIMTAREKRLFANIFKLSDEARNFANYAVRKLAENKSSVSAPLPSGKEFPSKAGIKKQAGIE